MHSLLCFFLLGFSFASTTDLILSVDTSRVYAYTGDYFLSVAIGISFIRHNLSGFDVTSPRFVNLAKHLSPAVFRMGGTSEDYVVFNSSGGGSDDSPKPPKADSYLQEWQWDMINDFSNEVGWNLIFGLNALLRYPNGSWDSTNAAKLLNYTASKNYSVAWELGNEPNSFPKNETVEPEQMAKDFLVLKDMINSLPHLGHFPVRLAGPDDIHKLEYYERFLKALGDRIDAATSHQYYENGRTAKVEDFTNPRLLDSLKVYLKRAKRIATKYAPSAQVWLGETSSAYGGGAPNLSDAFVAGNMWLDKLGLAALRNISVVCRQVYIGGKYALLNSSFYPFPDYYTSVLFKRLVGPKVLRVDDEDGRIVRYYAHCSLESRGSVVIYVMNLGNDTANLQLPSNLIGGPIDIYVLTPGSGGLTSKEILLNGKLLTLENDDLPSLKPITTRGGNRVNLPSKTYGFFVMHASVPACME